MSHPPANAGVSERPRVDPQIERYVDARQLAELMGVSPTTIKRMVAAGMPSETWGLSRTRRFLPSQSMRWAAARSKMPPGRECNAPDNRQQEE